MLRFPLEIDQRKPKREMPEWFVSFAAGVIGVLAVVAWFIVLAAITD